MFQAVTEISGSQKEVGKGKLGCSMHMCLCAHSGACLCAHSGACLYTVVLVCTQGCLFVDSGACLVAHSGAGLCAHSDAWVHTVVLACVHTNGETMPLLDTTDDK